MEKQQQFQSMLFGMVDFFPVKGKTINTRCRHCILQRSSVTDCVEAPCRPDEREDGQYGYYSIHQMPNNSNQ